MAFLISDQESLPFGFYGRLRWIILGLFILIGTGIYCTILKLKRIDIDNDYIYVSNYFKTVRIPYEQIESLTCKSISIRQIGKLNLKHKGIFGNKIYFIVESEKYSLLQSKITSQH
ncbi:MAG: hypothetical protein IT267_00785 [Saprospiraceae bacterium]|nr:hypothetical protein [Saprospiraceae bacterium]